MALKSLFPEEMMESKGSGSLTLETIAGKLTYFHLQAHILHWQTFGGFEHAALGDMYELIFSIKDEIVEKIMGYQGKRIKSFKIDPIKDYSTGASTVLASQIIEFAKQLEEYGESSNMPDIENISQALSGDIAKIKYRLTLT
jgi:DNA-binding ferritin-like protein